MCKQIIGQSILKKIIGNQMPITAKFQKKKGKFKIKNINNMTYFIFINENIIDAKNK